MFWSTVFRTNGQVAGNMKWTNVDMDTQKHNGGHSEIEWWELGDWTVGNRRLNCGHSETELWVLNGVHSESDMSHSKEFMCYHIWLPHVTPTK